jgi:hypothetical protein
VFWQIKAPVIRNRHTSRPDRMLHLNV